MNKMRWLLVALCGLLLAAGAYFARELLLNPQHSATTNPGAAQLQGKYDVAASPYFPVLDVYNMTSNDHLTILSHFKTKQQITGYTCACTAAAMVQQHFTGESMDELEMAKIMGTNQYTGTTIGGVAKYFEQLGWEVHTSLNSKSPENPVEFQNFVLQSLKNNTPIIVENVAWGGHYRVIIGYDTMGTSITNDDVLLMADSFDIGDHKQDGYNIEHAAKFYYMWFDSKLFSRNEQATPWIIARPK